MFRVRDNGQIEVAPATRTWTTRPRTPTWSPSWPRTPSAPSASIPVTIMVTDLDEMPDVTGDEMHDYAENGTGSGGDVHGDGPRGGMVIRWSLDGADASDFMIENGVLSFKKSPDFEMPAGGTADAPLPTPTR